MNPLAILKLIMGAVSLGKILWNMPKLYRFGKQFGPIAVHIIADRHLPSRLESQEFLHATADLVRSQIIDFPGVDEAAIGKVIDEMADELKSDQAAA